MFNVNATFATVHELDYSGTASWNPHGIKPSARVVLHLPGEPLSPACRIMGFRAHEGEGIHWPIKVGDIVLVFFLGGDAPQILNSTWCDGVQAPENAGPDNALFVLHGHKITMEKTGVSIETKDGKAVLLKDDAVSIAHPKGQTFVMDGKGNMAVSVPKDLNADVTGDMKASVKGSVDVSAEGYVQVKGKLGVDLDTENMINLKTAGLLAGVITNATHKQCHLMATPIGASQSVKAGS